MAYPHAASTLLTAPHPNLRRIDLQDLRAALKQGMDDFGAMPTHVLFLIAIYPVAGVLIAAATFEGRLIPILFPLASGFALIGPFAAITLYELSRRRELGLDTSWVKAFTPLTNRSAKAIGMVGAVLLILFVAWIISAMGLYWALFGETRFASMFALAQEVVTTPRGWALIVAGNLVGAAFSLLALAISAVTFPLIIDRGADAATAMETSLALVRENPRTMLVWGLTIVGLLVVGMLPLFIGLALVLPILGHATWHLYRRAVLP
ncbi:DUF2189 domain-containing protein [Methylorubrum zatmanii]|uniref:DUF2189 domain-containing protein n=1 Tax=Methylorubrum zatmanii TaxID=29429 RepID=A0ABW1WQR0_9HYPH|nr:DUF2189 domain-containing protein [Methylorubrum zatmanii]MBD8908994.1 hypothetical protein [Methylorubrum zatmanii]